jgi:hypothetical protein
MMLRLQDIFKPKNKIMETESMPLISSIGVTESAVGALFLATLLYFLQSIYFTPNLKHIPRVRGELGRKKLLKEYASDAKALHREGYKKVKRKSILIAFENLLNLNRSLNLFSEWQQKKVIAVVLTDSVLLMNGCRRPCHDPVPSSRGSQS